MMNIEEKQAHFLMDVSDKELLDFGKIFGNNHPLTLEIGSGKGEYLATTSRWYPERNFIAIELKQKRIITTLKKLDVKKHTNVRLLRLFVDKEICNFIPAGSIDEVIIYHPDPWWKKRHHKRRMFQHSFLDALRYIMRVGGLIHISTDHIDYAQWITDLFSTREDFENMYSDKWTEIPPENHLTTYFDKVKQDEGFETMFMKYRRK